MLIRSWYRNRIDSVPVAKSMSQSSWNSLRSRHKLGNENVVDHTIHTKVKAPAPLQKLIDHPEEVPSMTDKNPNLFEGASTKVVHDISKFKDPSDPAHAMSNIVMTKPYHEKVNYGYNLPIYGWATMATKNLFNAAGIGNMAEDVHASEQNGVPMTHHVFAPESFKTLNSMHDNDNPYSPRLADVHKIAAMDYLTGNVDRHSSNILVDPSSQGHNLLAIDHERNFQYKNHVGKHRGMSENDFDIPHDYLQHSALARAASNASAGMTPEEAQNHRASMASWWRKNSGNIRNEMARQASAIKDPAIKAHVTENFEDRAKALDNWASETGEGNYKTHDLFGEDFAIPTKIRTMSSRHLDPQALMQQHQDKDPDEILSGISRAIRQHPEYATPMSDTVRQITSKMDPDRIAQHFLNNYDQEQWNAGGDMIWHQPESKIVDILRALKTRLSKHPDKGSHEFPFIDAMLGRADKGLPLFPKTKEAA